MTDKIKQQCARCGSCAAVCPVFRATGRETLCARGKLHLLETPLAETPSSHFQDIFTQCLLCGACEADCSRGLPIRERIVEARSGFSRFYGAHPVQRALARQALSRPALLEALVKAGLSLAKLSLLPADSGLRIKLGLLEQGAPADSTDQSDPAARPGNQPAYFAGCMTRYLQPSISRATKELVRDRTGQTLHEPQAQACCGLAAWSAGKLDEARQLARKNILAFAQTSGDILASCASCSFHLQNYPALFRDDPHWLEQAEQFSARVREFTAFADTVLEENRLTTQQPAKILYHEPCHLRFAPENRGAARKLLGRIAGLAPVNRESRCCGQGGLFHLGCPDISDAIFSTAYEQLNDNDVELVVTTCSGCLMQWQAGLAARKSGAKAVHLAVWLHATCK